MRTPLRIAICALATIMLVPTTPSLAQSSPRQVSNNDDEDDDSERLVCRRETETGSLAKGRRICLTRAQMERQAERQQRAANEIQEAYRTRSSGE